MQTGILFVSATRFEVEALLANAENISGQLYKTDRYFVLIGGIGLMHMSHSLTYTLAQTPEIKQVIHLGIAGDYQQDTELGTVMQMSSASFGDLGTLNPDGFQSFYDDGLLNASYFPFENSIIKNYTLINNKAVNTLPKAHCVTLNMLSTQKELIEQRKQKAIALSSKKNIVEHMECLAVFYVSMQMRLPFISLLATSNHVGEADKKNWELRRAITNLNTTAQAILKEFPIS